MSGDNNNDEDTVPLSPDCVQRNAFDGQSFGVKISNIRKDNFKKEKN